MPLRRPLRLLPTMIAAALLTLTITVGAALMPAGPAIAAASAARGSVTVTFTSAGIWGGSLRSTYALSTKQVPAQFFILKRSWGAGGTAPVTAVVERRPSGGTWKATTQRVTSSSATFRLLVPAYSTSSTAKDATVAYRLRVKAAGVVGHGDVSDAITVRYRNPARFTGITRSLHSAVHPYCRSAVVRLVDLGGDAAGDFTTGQFALRIDRSVAGYAARDRRAVALHECGHYLQWRNYGASAAGWSRMTADARAVFGTNSKVPVEHMADCIAQKANPGGYMGYGGTCTRAQLAAAKRVLDGGRAR